MNQKHSHVTEARPFSFQPSTDRTSLPVVPPSGPAIEVRDLRVRYGRQLALANVSLDVPRGLVMALVGPSGCGKSTFLSCLNRLTDLTDGCRVEGLIQVDHCRVNSPDCELSQLRRRIGMVFQKPNPFPMSIKNNLAVPLREHRYPKSEIDDRVRQALSQTGLWDEVSDRLNQSALQLSGGQQQRLCIARALALEPEIMLFDEPCSALDPVSSGVVEDLIASLRGQLTVVIVTHNLAQARRIADRVAVFWVRDGAGTIIETADTTALFENATDPVAAAFLNGQRG